METYHHKFSFNEDILNANIVMLNKGSRKSHAEFRVRVYWGSELVFQECNLWNPFLVVVHDGFSLNKTGRILP